LQFVDQEHVEFDCAQPLALQVSPKIAAVIALLQYWFEILMWKHHQWGDMYL